MPDEVVSSALQAELAHNDPPSEEKLGKYHYSREAQTGEPLARFSPLTEMGQWWDRWGGINIHRSVALVVGRNGDLVRGPLVLDIDGPPELAYPERIEDALKATVRVWDWVVKETREGSARLYFSGSKGFNIEIDPSYVHPTKWGSFRRQILRSLRVKAIDGIDSSGNTIGYRGSVLDPLTRQTLKRVSNSINCWLEGGVLHRATRLQLDHSTFREAEVSEIIAESIVTD